MYNIGKIEHEEEVLRKALVDEDHPIKQNIHNIEKHLGNELKQAENQLHHLQEEIAIYEKQGTSLSELVQRTDHAAKKAVQNISKAHIWLRKRLADYDLLLWVASTAATVALPEEAIAAKTFTHFLERAEKPINTLYIEELMGRVEHITKEIEELESKPGFEVFVRETAAHVHQRYEQMRVY